MSYPASPRRLQRNRRKGAPLPEGAVYVGRPTRWGNPFPSERFGHARAIALHRRWIAGRMSTLALEKLGFCPAECAAIERLRAWIINNLHRLQGRDLVCWCPCTSKWCHADALLALAARMAAIRTAA